MDGRRKEKVERHGGELVEAMGRTSAEQADFHGQRVEARREANGGWGPNAIVYRLPNDDGTVTLVFC